jgi:hypothetical protein
LLTKAERFRVHLVSSLPEADVRSMGLHPARTLEEALAAADTEEPGYVMPRGAAFMPVVGPEPADVDTFLQPGIH